MTVISGVPRFVLDCPITKTDFAMEAGLRRDSDRSHWYTTDVKIAARLRNFADGPLRDRLNVIAAENALKPTLSFEKGLYVFRADREMAEVARNAEFFRNPDTEHWYTADAHYALRLFEYGDDNCRVQIRTSLAAMEEMLAASHALDADLAIPAPAGRNYFPHQRAAVAYAKKVLRIGDPSLNGDAIPGVLIGDEMRVGKGGTDSTNILTPHGWITFADVEVGHRVIGSDGSIHTVTGVFPRGVQDIYRVSLNDGTSVLCDGDHLWQVATAQGRYNESFERVLSTSEILRDALHSTGSRKNAVHFIPVLSRPAEFEGIGELPLDPYFLGAILGDGSICQGSPGFTTADEEMIRLLEATMPVGVKISSRRRDKRLKNSQTTNLRFGRISLRQKTNPLCDALKTMGLWSRRSEQKFVPEVYKWALPRDREALLQGLLDTDGSTDAVGRIEFTSTSRQLREDVVFLVQSLGGIATRGERETFYTDRRGKRIPCKRAYRTNIVLPKGVRAFRLKRKADRWHAPTTYAPCRSIKSIERAGRENVTCIRVDSPDSLYVTDEFIVTHNTASAIGVVNLGADLFRKILIISPAGVKLGWYRELNAWLTTKRKILIADSATSAWKFEAADISIVNFDILKDLAEWQRKQSRDKRAVLRSLGRLDLDWDLVIIDEAHLIKNSAALRSIVCYALLDRARRKMALTGTPITSWIEDLYALLHSLDPVSWPTLSRFKSRYGSGRDARNLDELKRRLRSTVMCRRLLREVQPGLPPKIREVLEFSADDVAAQRAVEREAIAWQRQEERLIALAAAAELAKASDDTRAHTEASKLLGEGKRIAFNETAKLRHETALVKVPYVVEHVKSLIEDPTYKVVVGAWHTDVIEKLAASFGNRAVTVSGAVSTNLKVVGGRETSDRMQRVDRFLEDPLCQVLFGQLIAAGMGLNMSSSSHIVCAEIWYVPYVMKQFESRCEQPEKTTSIFVQQAVLAGSIDARIARALIDKQVLIDQALDGGSEKEEVSLLDEPATKNLTRAAIEREAERISVTEIAAVHRALKEGFSMSPVDAAIARALAGYSVLSAKQAVLGQKILEKYAE
jgi:hypothetical protein